MKQFTQVDMLRQKGSALMMSLFVMVILILLGNALVKVLSSSSEATAQEVIGTRAYMAANSDMQAKLQQLFPLNDGTLVCDPAPPINDLSHIEGLFHCEAYTTSVSYTHLTLPTKRIV